MASTASGRGRPAILDKSELSLGNGNSAVIRLVGEGNTVQVELPLSWSLDALQRSATKTGGRTKVTFTFDGETAPSNGNGSAPEAAAAETNGESKPARTRVTKKVADPEAAESEATESEAPAAKAPRRSRSKNTA